MLQVAEAESKLRQMLHEAGFGVSTPDPQLAWQVFKQFMNEQVVCAVDGAMFECGVLDFAGAPRFYCGFVRVLTVNRDDTYDHMDHIGLILTCPPTPASRKRVIEQCAESNAEFLAAAESLPEFASALSHTGWACEIYRTRV